MASAVIFNCSHRYRHAAAVVPIATKVDALDECVATGAAADDDS